MEITYEVATKAINNAHASGRPDEEPYSVTVLDSGRNLLAFARFDGALLASIECSRGKAYAAVSLGTPSDALSPLIQPGQPLYGLETSHEKPLVMFKGGIPVKVNGKLLGAVGVAGGPLEQDERIAMAIAEDIANHVADRQDDRGR